MRAWWGRKGDVRSRRTGGRAAPCRGCRCDVARSSASTAGDASTATPSSPSPSVPSSPPSPSSVWECSEADRCSVAVAARSFKLWERRGGRPVDSEEAEVPAAAAAAVLTTRNPDAAPRRCGSAELPLLRRRCPSVARARLPETMTGGAGRRTSVPLPLFATTGCEVPRAASTRYARLPQMPAA